MIPKLVIQQIRTCDYPFDNKRGDHSNAGLSTPSMLYITSLLTDSQTYKHTHTHTHTHTLSLSLSLYKLIVVMDSPTSLWDEIVNLVESILLSHVCGYNASLVCVYLCNTPMFST